MPWGSACTLWSASRILPDIKIKYTIIMHHLRCHSDFPGVVPALNVFQISKYMFSDLFWSVSVQECFFFLYGNRKQCRFAGTFER